MELLKNLYEISSPSGREKLMIRFITGWLRKSGIRYRVDRYGNIYAVKGRSHNYPCVVAHTDEVHGRRSKNYEAVTLRDEIVFGYDSKLKRFIGTGADDKNGIWICLKCLEEFECIKCVFFTGEETGCTGSRMADMAFFEDCRYVLECDRKGSGDLVTSISGVELCSDRFLYDIDAPAFGYAPVSGLMTDVLMLKERGLEVSCVNISCGYYEPHTDREFTVISELENCLRFVSGIIRNCKEAYPHRYEPAVYCGNADYDPMDYYSNRYFNYRDNSEYASEGKNIKERGFHFDGQR